MNAPDVSAVASFLGSPLFVWGILPLCIFLARILDVSLGTMRIIFISRGMKYAAPVIGFFEIMIWLLAITQIMRNLGNWANYVAYALGYSSGTMVGIMIEEKLAMGSMMIRVITRKEAGPLVSWLRNAGHGVTSVKAEGENGEVAIIFTVVRRKNLARVVGIIKEFNPNAFYTMEDVRLVAEGPPGIVAARSPGLRRFFRKRN